MIPVRARTIVAVAAALLGACSWGRFDDQSKTTWVVSNGKPDRMNSASFGLAVGTTATNTSSGTIVAEIGVRNAAIGVLAFAGDGSLGASDGDVPNEATDPAGYNPKLVGFDSVIGSGLIAWGFPDGQQENDGGVQLYQLAPLTELQFLTAPGHAGADARVGEDVATGDTDIGPAGDPEIAATGVDNLSVFQNIAGFIENPDANPLTSAICHLTGGDALGVLIADLDHDGPGEVLVGRGDGNGASDVHVLGASAVMALDNMDCFSGAGEYTAPGGETDFGARMVRGDFNGNGDDDVVIAAPDANVVYVYLDGATGSPITVTADGSGLFGDALAAGDLNNDGNDELIVGARETAVDGTRGAGAVYVFELGGGDFGAPVELHDVSPNANQLFGRSVAVAEFQSGSGTHDILVVGADNETFTYFRVPLAGSVDVRE